MAWHNPIVPCMKAGSLVQVVAAPAETPRESAEIAKELLGVLVILGMAAALALVARGLLAH